jgi:hypothetical protein
MGYWMWHYLQELTKHPFWHKQRLRIIFQSIEEDKTKQNIKHHSIKISTV